LSSPHPVLPLDGTECAPSRSGTDRSPLKTARTTRLSDTTSPAVSKLQPDLPCPPTELCDVFCRCLFKVLQLVLEQGSFVRQEHRARAGLPTQTSHCALSMELFCPRSCRQHCR
jgi:hypothetical protein